MRIQNVILLVLLCVSLTGGAIAFGYYLSVDDKEAVESKSTATQSINRGSTGLSVSTPNGTGQLLGENVDETTDNSQRLPGPDEFEVYEQYANERSALVAELEIGDGNQPQAGDLVYVVYRGWLTDGTLFDESRTNSEGQIEAFSFTLGSGQVIRGWDEGIAGMRVGGRRRLVIPPAVGYGETGQGSIPPNATLIFDVELVQIDPQGPPNGL